jgi:hypothetical protein
LAFHLLAPSEGREVNDQEPNKSRSALEIRKSIDANRDQIEEDLAELGDRLEAGVNPVRQLGRHPVVLAVAGAVVGVLVIRNPALVWRSMGRMVKWGAPLLVSTLLRSRGEIAAREAATPKTSPEN